MDKGRILSQYQTITHELECTGKKRVRQSPCMS